MPSFCFVFYLFIFFHLNQTLVNGHWITIMLFRLFFHIFAIWYRELHYYSINGIPYTIRYSHYDLLTGIFVFNSFKLLTRIEFPSYQMDNAIQLNSPRMTKENSLENWGINLSVTYEIDWGWIEIIQSTYLQR